MFAKFNIDPRIFIPATSLILITCSLVAFYPASSEAIINDVFKWVTQRFGWLYLLAGISSFIFMAWLAFGRLGRIKLGRADETPEFSKFSWVSMLFCAGIGISLCNWAFVEPLYFLDTPPMHIEKGSDTAIEWAAMYPIFHWGLVPWALYLVPALPIAYELYVRRNNAMRFSQACRALIGDHADGLLGKIIDIIVILSIIGGVGTSLGLSVPLVSQLLGQALGFEPLSNRKSSCYWCGS